MLGVPFTLLVFLVLSTACAKEKFQDRGSTESQAADVPAVDTPPAIEEAPEEAAVIPSNAMESTVGSEPTPVQKPLFADCQNTPDRPIVGDLYQLATDTKVLPDYTKMKAIKQVCLSQLDIKTRKFSDGFPGVEKLFEWFSLDLHFAIKVPKDGKWEFKLVADDGAVLVIDKFKLIDNDGVHQTQEKTGRMQLSSGLHDVRVSYFQGPRYNIALELYWKGPLDREFSYIPAANLARPRPSAAPLLSAYPRPSSPD